MQRFGKSNLPPEFVQRLRFAFSGSSSAQRSQQSPRILWRSQKMRNLYEAGELIGGNHRNRFVTPSAHDHNFMVIRHAIKH